MNPKQILFLFAVACLGSVHSLAKALTVTFEKTPHGGIQPQVIVDASGTLHLLYYKGQPREGDLFYVSRGKGQKGFSVPLQVKQHCENSACCIGSIFRARMAIGQGGVVHVLWNGSFGFVKKAVGEEKARSAPRRNSSSCFTPACRGTESYFCLKET